MAQACSKWTLNPIVLTGMSPHQRDAVLKYYSNPSSGSFEPDTCRRSSLRISSERTWFVGRCLWVLVKVGAHAAAGKVYFSSVAVASQKHVPILVSYRTV